MSNHDCHTETLTLRGLRHHVRRWGAVDGTPLLLLHGWLDAAATFSELVQTLLGHLPQYTVWAPDLRGFGDTEWPQEGYWFPEYLADVDALVAHYGFDHRLCLIGHSMGAQIASLYAGLRPKRIHKLVLLDAPTLPELPVSRAASRYRAWLDDQRQPADPRTFPSFEALISRVAQQHRRLDLPRARAVAQAWGRENPDGSAVLRADPRHWQRGPTLYRSAEAEAVWRDIEAETLFLDAADSHFIETVDAEEKARRRTCFRKRQERVINDAGHMLHFDAPSETAAVIADFLSNAAP